jgi:CelD/BcsL family acetyltransferase involved in cellulose biosynthesis
MRSVEPGPRVETFETLEALPDDAAPLFAAARTFFSTRAWWEAVLAHAIPMGASPRLLLVRVDGEAMALFPMLLDPANSFRSLTTPYTCLYEPLFPARVRDTPATTCLHDPPATPRLHEPLAATCLHEPPVADVVREPRCDAVRAAVFAAFARVCRSFPTTRLDGLDQATEADFARGARQAGLSAARFDHFGNWHEDVASLDWAGYLARRPGALRETIRRRTRRAERLSNARFGLFENTNDLDTGIAAFETVYARSWKQPEPYPSFNPAQIRAAAGLGVLRLGIWWIGEIAAAAQFWIVERGEATVLKLAHDEAFKAHSPGTVLTAWMIRHMIEREHAATLDFGRGDDPYKRDWVSCRRQRTGLVLIDPRRPAGMIALARHTAGRVWAGLRQQS